MDNGAPEVGVAPGPRRLLLVELLLRQHSEVALLRAAPHRQVAPYREALLRQAGALKLLQHLLRAA